jgi:hypothetical protein
MLRRWRSRLAVAAVLAVTACLGLAGPAHAAALTNVTWSMSNPQPSATGVRYTWAFTTPTGGTIQSITFTVPATTAGAVLTVADAYGLTGGTAALAGTTVTYTVTTPGPVAAGSSILVSLDGFTNTATPNPYTSTVTTVVGGVNTDTAASGAVTISNNSTTVNVVVARSTSFTSSATSLNMHMDPSVPALADKSQAVNLTIATNATNGYTLNVKTNQPLTGAHLSNPQFTPATADMTTGVASGAFANGTFGYAMTATGVGSLQSTPLSNGNYVGYRVAGDDVVSANAPTSGDTVVVTNRAKINHSQRPDAYSATVTYTVTPNY